MGIKIGTKDKMIWFGVMSIPNRKAKALYTVFDNEVSVLAYFRNDECAEKFNEIIAWMLDVLPKEGRYDQ